MKPVRNQTFAAGGRAVAAALLSSFCLLGASMQNATAALISGEAANFTILGLEGGEVIINSATSIGGNVGYGKDVVSNTNQKVDSFDGTAYVHSSATFVHTPATYAPTGGIVNGGAADALLEQANADALASAAGLAALVPSVNLGALGDDDSLVLNSSGSLNVFSLASLKYKEDVLELVSRPGMDDQFVFNILGDFDFDNSEIRLTGVSVENVVFNFLSAADITIGKAGTIFMGAILAPTGSVDYHNPATFTGSIIAKSINLHSDFNIAGVPPNPIPVPGAPILFTTGLFGLVVTRFGYGRSRAS